MDWGCACRSKKREDNSQNKRGAAHLWCWWNGGVTMTGEKVGRVYMCEYTGKVTTVQGHRQKHKTKITHVPEFTTLPFGVIAT
jgi:hypothetical protein